MFRCTIGNPRLPQGSPVRCPAAPWLERPPWQAAQAISPLDAASPMIASMLDRYGSAVVTGGLGFVGHWLVAALDRLGQAATVVDNAVPATGLPLPPNAT